MVKALRAFLIILITTSQLFSQNNEKKLVHEFFLIGDVGEPSLGKDETLDKLEKQLNKAEENSTLIFLGDNIYPKGLPDEGDPLRPEMEKKLLRQLEVTENYKGDVYFIHGNHDWDKSKKNGWKRALNQEKFLSEYFGRDSVLIPEDACPGPYEIQVSKDITLVVINFQWLLHPWDKPGEEDGCSPSNKLEVLEKLDEIVRRNKDRKILLAQHHPLFTYGEHAGTYSIKQHLFPLTSINHNLYIPLPVIGSIYPFYRTFLGDKQDETNYEYRALRNAMHDILKKHKDVIHVAGHEHSLQYNVKDDVSYIVSGSGCKTTLVREGELTKFHKSAEGYAVVKYYSDQTTDVDFYTDVDSGVVFSTTIKNEVVNDRKASMEKFDPDQLRDSVVTTYASKTYARKSKFLLGSNYRDVWELPLKVPVFDIGSERGGLEIVKRGGGMQTKSLRLEASNGKQYVLRSIEKYPEKAIPNIIRKTFAGSIVKDQISASHPYGALIVPYLAEAADIYHTNPELVYIPDDPRLGKYREDFKNTLALYEERPQGAATDQAYFGNADKVVSTFKVIKKLKKDNDNRIDQEFVLRNRLFDMLIGDWDRHDDQWRWAKYKGEKGDLYRPIPRDRDQAFFINEGLIPKISSRKWGVPKIEGFDKEVNWAPGLMFNGRYFDRSFLTELSREQWIHEVQKLQLNMTDTKIEAAVRKWPAKVFKKDGEWIIEALKSRRDLLMSSAMEYYDFLAKEVDVLGSDKTEKFIVKRHPDGNVEVEVMKISKHGDLQKTLFNRTFVKSETKEIRLHGFAGDDVYELEGEVNKSILVRIISGTGNDLIIDNSKVSGWGKKTKVYDNPDNVKIEASKETKTYLDESGKIHDYDRRAFVYNTLMPLVDVNYNRDDGLFVGGGFLYTDRGWRKSPFKSRHKLTGNIAFATNSFNFNYQATFTDILGKWDLEMETDIQEPKFVGNYFGLGNTSSFDFQNRDIDFYRVRFENNTYSLGLSKGIGSKGKFSIGALHRGIEIQNRDSETFVNEQRASGALPEELFSREYYYSGLNSTLSFDTRDHPKLTNGGVLWKTNLQALKGWNSFSSNLYKLTSDFRTYIRLRVPFDFVLANRVGFSRNLNGINAAEFFNASSLGGLSNLRSYRRTRFYGNTSFYHNVDMRIKLLSFRTYLFPGELGILGFHDVGRVWLDSESSDNWHTSRGFGLWMAPAKQIVVSLNYGFSEDENLPFVNFGFFF